MAIFNSRQKVYIWCIYTHFDINKIYESKKAGHILLLLIWISKTEWMSDVTESYLYWVFSVGPDYFFTKNMYSWVSHANLAIWWWRSSEISSRTVVDLCLFFTSCNDSVLNSNYPWILSCYFSNNKKTYWLFTDYICNIYLIL